MHKFDMGDRVIYKVHEFSGNTRKHDAKVLKILSDDPTYGKMYLVEFEEKDLIPPQMSVPENRLDSRQPSWSYQNYIGPLFGDDAIDPETNCPKCGRKWKVTQVFLNTYHDCINCNVKREDFVRNT